LITVITASVPDAIQSAPFIINYESSNSIKIGFSSPLKDGGFPITSFKLYVDNNFNQTLTKDEPHIHILSGLTQGTNYKLQVSSMNQIGESELSPPIIFLFAAVPSQPLSLTLSSEIGKIIALWT
jgi:hypothetical protein